MEQLLHAQRVEIGGELRTGDVEIHVRPGDWNAHGHSADPAYADVALHVAWFPPAPDEVLPEIPLALLRDAMLDRPGFSFDQIDPSAYPRPPRSDLDRPSRDALAAAPPAEVASLLARAFHLPAEGEEPVPLYRSENPSFDPFLFIYW